MSKLHRALWNASDSESQLEYILLLPLWDSTPRLTGKHSPDEPRTMKRPRLPDAVGPMTVDVARLLPLLASGASHDRRFSISIKRHIGISIIIPGSIWSRLCTISQSIRIVARTFCATRCLSNDYGRGYVFRCISATFTNRRQSAKRNYNYSIAVYSLRVI